MLTDISPMPICQGSTDPLAVRSLMSLGTENSLYHLRNLHAKVYVSDGVRAIVTSGNLTAGGLFNNHEYSICVHDLDVAARVHGDISDYIRLSALLDDRRLEEYCRIAERVRVAYRSQIKAASDSAAREFENSLREAEDELLRARLQDGPIHRVFQNSILHLLKQFGPLGTKQLHPLIEELHPDLCDNSVDRVIDGIHFGKKWKHAARTAQQILKQKGLSSRT